MPSEPTRSDILTEEVLSLGRELRARRAELAVGPLLDALASESLQTRRDELRRTRATLDLATTDGFGRPS